MRKHVKPADPAASIPDPARKTDLPPEGRVVDWSVHWARLAAREDIVVSDVAGADAAETKAEVPVSAADAGAGANPQADAPKPTSNAKSSARSSAA